MVSYNSRKQAVFKSYDSPTLDICFDWESTRENILSAYDEVLSYQQCLRERLSDVDQKIGDCLHACEFNNKCGTSDGYKLYLMIRDFRLERRAIKQELEKTSIFLDMNYSSVKEGKFEEAFAPIFEQVYTPRKLPEIFTDLEVG